MSNNSVDNVASFPGSTSQLFSHCARKAGEWSLGTIHEVMIMLIQVLGIYIPTQ